MFCSTAIGECAEWSTDDGPLPFDRRIEMRFYSRKPECDSHVWRAEFCLKSALPLYTSIGSYPLFYLVSDVYGRLDGEVFCGVCAAKERDTRAFGIMCGEDWKPAVIHTNVHWEGGPLFCCDCGREIASAYGSEAS